MMVAIEAKNKKEVQKVIKQYRLKFKPSTIHCLYFKAIKKSNQWCIYIFNEGVVIL